MKRLLAMFLAAALCVLSLAACSTAGDGAGSESEASASEASVSEASEASVSEASEASDGEMGESSTNETASSLTIGLSINANDQFRTDWTDAFVTMAEEKGHTVYSTNADNDASTQISDIESLIERSPDVIVYTAVDAASLQPSIENAKAQGIKVVGVDSCCGIEVDDASVMDSQGQNGVIQGEMLLKWLDEEEGRTAQIGYIVGMYSMEAAMPRMYEFQTIAEADDRCEWLVDQECEWSGATAVSITEDWIQKYPDMNVFACMSDEIAIGAIQALKAAGKDMDEVLVMGVDGSEAAMEYLRSGELDGSAARDMDKEVEIAIDAAERLCNGETFDDVIEPEAIYSLYSEDVT